ncbi:MAG: RNase adaptor protein RapZ, partial [Clostridia bacterium]|nr:RNase adaptor protein RapZ [Clostridia bacterium]
NDKEVQDYVMSFPTAVKFMEKLQDLMSFMIPLYIEEGKISLTIAIGCTGGKHRSVTMTNKLADYLKSKDYEVSITYRDLGKE